MIFKSFNVEKNISLIDNLDAVLFYGENIGLKDDFKNYIKKHNKDVERISLFQNDIINNNIIYNQIFSLANTASAPSIIVCVYSIYINVEVLFVFFRCLKNENNSIVKRE